jgi:PAS domain S-box-containing protein
MQMLKHLAMVTEQSSEGIVVVDLKGVLRFVNTAWAKMHGYGNSSELVGKRIGLFHTEEQMKSEVMPFMKEAKRRGRFMGPLGHVRRDGTTFPTRMKMAMLRNEGGKASGMMVFAADITEYKEVEDALGDTTKRLKELQQQIEQLSQQTVECEPAEEGFSQSSAELEAVDEQLQPEITEPAGAQGQLDQGDDLEQCVDELAGELAAADEKLQPETSGPEQAKEMLAEDVNEVGASDQEIELLNPEKLRALSQLARRLR